MALVSLGEQSLSSIVPGLGTAIAALQASSAALTAMKADKNSEFNAVLAQAAAINDVLTSAQSVLAGAQTLLNEATNVLNNSDALLANLASALAAAGIHEYAYSGTAGNLGTEVSAALGSGVPGGTGEAEQIFGLLLLTADGGAWSAISTVLRTS